MANLLQSVKKMFKGKQVPVPIPIEVPREPRTKPSHTHEIRIMKSQKESVIQNAVKGYTDRHGLHDLAVTHEDTDAEVIYRWTAPPNPACGCSHHLQDSI